MKEFSINPFEKFNNEWALVTAGTKDKFNSMTISWGTFGTIWNKSVAIIFIRSNRYTFDILKNNDTFTISFYDEIYKDKLVMFGKCSGKDVNKVEKSGFTPIVNEMGITYKEAKETIYLKKMYMDKINKGLLDEKILEFYKEDPEHYIIIGEVVRFDK